MKRKIILRALLVVCAIVVAIILYAVFTIVTFADSSGTGNADAAVVLGAAVWGDRPSPVFRERINHAVTLYREGRVRKIIFTGAPDSGNEPSESLAAMKYAINAGVPVRDILIEEKSRTTEENLTYALVLSREHGLKTLLVVSDPLHMKRAMMIARDIGMDARQAPTPTTRVRGVGSRLRFLSRELYFYLSYHAGKLAGGSARQD